MTPELVRNPQNAPASLLSAFTSKTGSGTGTQTGGLSDDLSKSPIDQILMRAGITNGVNELNGDVQGAPAEVRVAQP